jgi:16S rRNA (uracil1498-N3)-methyltransferase
MPRRRFFVPRAAISGSSATLPANQAHHLRHVLRIKAGEEVEIFDGEGAGYAGVVEVRGREVKVVSLVRVLERTAPADRSIVLGAALIKAERFDWLIQKATELGVEKIVPLETRFSDIRIREDRIESRVERWNRIVREASRQCGRDSVPAVSAPLRFTEFASCPDLEGYGKFLCWEKCADRWSQSLLCSSRVVLAVGPEGGWDGAEVETAGRAGFCSFSLGGRILRAETAALVAVMLFQLRASDGLLGL